MIRDRGCVSWLEGKGWGLGEGGRPEGTKERNATKRRKCENVKSVSDAPPLAAMGEIKRERGGEGRREREN